ncbi:MAG: TetR/AcrR family transcriptional regulator [Gammaproteobacteria bacterium]|jgi:AcrR family transcriptional regulator|nr:TetR/AcrR family transcriptional regulator [Gammaproteobacteria bacterium]MBT5202058.1 TetR/AcrR family transcriptional regulator [Gammaproteobacteria bacterium]MBT5603050.1 TetR/AcrR family transcriptional regulator [Gammaproteobacteria bacterium]MBT6245342.1 TetR/AcrR family transcriptional regulator [Gammaproteobacteria bacterium]
MVAKGPASADSARTRILDSAERIFVQKGFVGSSLRAITSAAGVNLAAAHYYFGSKQGLFKAVFCRCLAPINEQRLLALDTLLRENPKPDLRDILAAFLRPVMLHSNQDTLDLMAQMTAEPEELTNPILAEQFGELVTRYTAGLQLVFPKMREQELNVKLTFVIGAMLQTIFNRSFFINVDEVSKEEKCQQLLNFSVAGFLNNDQPGIPKEVELHD